MRRGLPRETCGFIRTADGSERDIYSQIDRSGPAYEEGSLSLGRDAEAYRALDRTDESGRQWVSLDETSGLEDDADRFQELCDQA